MRITIVTVLQFGGERSPRHGKVLVEAARGYSDRFTRIVTIACGTASDHMRGSAGCRTPAVPIAAGKADYAERLNEAAVELLAGVTSHAGARTIVARCPASVPNPYAPYGDQARSVRELMSAGSAARFPDAGTRAAGGVLWPGDLITAAAPRATISTPARQALAETAGRNPRS